MLPSHANGKICYLELPAIDIKQSADFYASIFGWEISKRGDGQLAFHDGVEVSGTWVAGRPPAAEPGLMVYIMVDSVAATVDALVANGGALVEPICADARQVTARFRDPAGNVIGLYQDKP